MKLLPICGATLLVLAMPLIPAHAATSSYAMSPAVDDGAGKLLLMLDASGSMKDKDPSGVTKLDAAKRALTSVVQGLPVRSPVGLRVYGATQPGGTPTPAACHDTQLVAPIAPLDTARLTTAIAGFHAKGETPIAYSLGEALKDLGPTGKRSIVLVSDGLESCTPDPCPQVQRLVAAGVDLRIDTVGFAVDPRARAQLQCLATAGHGTYYDAKDAGQLTTSLRKLSVRAFRPFAIGGRPVSGTTSPLDAPHLPAGQYVDSVPTTNGTRYYRISRHAGSTLRIAVASRPERRGDRWNEERWGYELTNLKGNTCASASDARFDSTGSNPLLSSTLTLNPTKYTSCADDTDLVLKIKRPEGGTAPSPTQITVMEEAAVTNVDALPPAVDKAPLPLRPVVGVDQPVIGGTGFDDAQKVGPGTYVADIAPGEMAFFAVPLAFGQSATFAIDGPTKGFTQWAHEGYKPLWIRSAGYSPARAEYGTNNSSFRADSYPDDAVLALPEVRYRNRQSYSTGISQIATAGQHYLAVTMGAADLGATIGGSVPVRFSVRVAGTPSGAPAYAPLGAAGPTDVATGSPAPAVSASTSTSPATPVSAATSSAVAAAPAAASGGIPTGAWVGGGALAALAAIGAGVAAALRRKP